jgi:hypothetical protein
LVIEYKSRVEKLRKSKSDSDKERCDVSGCEEKVKKAVSYKKIQNALPNLKFDKPGKRVHLCKNHYKDFKKVTKTERKLEKLTWE